MGVAASAAAGSRVTRLRLRMKSGAWDSIRGSQRVRLKFRGKEPKDSSVDPTRVLSDGREGGRSHGVEGGPLDSAIKVCLRSAVGLLGW